MKKNLINVYTDSLSVKLLVKEGEKNAGRIDERSFVATYIFMERKFLSSDMCVCVVVELFKLITISNASFIDWSCIFLFFTAKYRRRWIGEIAECRMK